MVARYRDSPRRGSRGRDSSRPKERQSSSKRERRHHSMEDPIRYSSRHSDRRTRGMGERIESRQKQEREERRRNDRVRERRPQRRSRSRNRTSANKRDDSPELGRRERLRSRHSRREESYDESYDDWNHMPRDRDLPQLGKPELLARRSTRGRSPSRSNEQVAAQRSKRERARSRSGRRIVRTSSPEIRRHRSQTPDPIVDFSKPKKDDVANGRRMSWFSRSKKLGNLKRLRNDRADNGLSKDEEREPGNQVRDRDEKVSSSLHDTAPERDQLLSKQDDDVNAPRAKWFSLSKKTRKDKPAKQEQSQKRTSNDDDVEPGDNDCATNSKGSSSGDDMMNSSNGSPSEDQSGKQPPKRFFSKMAQKLRMKTPSPKDSQVAADHDTRPFNSNDYVNTVIEGSPLQSKPRVWKKKDPEPKPEPQKNLDSECSPDPLPDSPIKESAAAQQRWWPAELAMFTKSEDPHEIVSPEAGVAAPNDAPDSTAAADAWHLGWVGEMIGVSSRSEDGLNAGLPGSDGGDKGYRSILKPPLPVRVDSGDEESTIQSMPSWQYLFWSPPGDESVSSSEKQEKERRSRVARLPPLVEDDYESE